MKEIRDTETGERGTVAFDVTTRSWRECYGCMNEVAPGKAAHEVRWSEVPYTDPYHAACFDKVARESGWAVR